jgi:hypothetical protein
MTRRPPATAIVVNAAAAGLPPGSVDAEDTTELAIVAGVSVAALAIGLFIGKQMACRRT